MNRLVVVIGSQVEPGLLISKIEQEFGLRAAHEAAERKATQEGELRALARTVHQMGYYDDATALARRLGFQVAEVGGGFFSSPRVQVESSTGGTMEHKTTAAFVYWVQKNLCSMVPGTR